MSALSRSAHYGAVRRSRVGGRNKFADVIVGKPERPNILLERVRQMIESALFVLGRLNAAAVDENPSTEIEKGRTYPPLINEKVF